MNRRLLAILALLVLALGGATPLITPLVTSVAFGQIDEWPQGSGYSLIGPATESDDVTPNDTTPLRKISRAIRHGGTAAADIAVKFKSGRTKTYKNVQPGETIPVRATHVLATGTTATIIDAHF